MAMAAIMVPIGGKAVISAGPQNDVNDPEPAWALIAQDRDAFYDAEIEQLFGAVGGPKWDKVPRRPEYRGRGRGGAQHRRTD
jgi:hypothetical protein